MSVCVIELVKDSNFHIVINKKDETGGFIAVWEEHLGPPHVLMPLSFIGAPSTWHAMA